MTGHKSPSSVKDEDCGLSGDVVGSCETYTLEEEKAILRKIDMVILPFVR